MTIRDYDPRPFCAKCGRKVDELRRWDDPCTGDTVFEARCHGAREQTRFRPSQMVAMIAVPELLPGVAFDAPALLPSDGVRP